MLLLSVFLGVLVASAIPLVFRPPIARSEPARSEPHRSPYDLAVLPDGRHALTANHGADSASLVDLAAGKVLAELPCDRRPAAVACSRDGRLAAVSNLWSDSLTLIEVEAGRLRSLGEVPVGHQPRGVVFAPDGKTLYAALGGDNVVVQLDLKTRKVLRRWPAAREPRRLALTRDGKYLLAASARSAQVRCWDTATGKLAWEHTVSGSFNLHGLTLTPDDRDVATTHIHHRQHTFVKHNIEQGWALNSRVGWLAVRPAAGPALTQIALDVRNKAVGDPAAPAYSAKGDVLAVAAAGTQELLLFAAEAISRVGGEPGDFLDSLLQDDVKFRRVPLGGRPLAVQFVTDTNHAAVANYLLDAVQVVDVKAGKVARTIALGGPSRPSLARRGEAIFYDAKRSHHDWFSCHTCHPDGHTSGRAFDTLNDDSDNNPKMSPTLRGVTKTGPWTWHGWQKSLPAAVEKSLTQTLWGKKPTADDVEAVVAFLGTLEHPPNPRVRGEAAERGKALFQGKARCARCHQGEYYTSSLTYDVKLPPDGSAYDTWNPPSLRGVYDRGPFLHDGSAETLDELLRLPHAPEKLGGKALTAEERRDLVAFLESL
jgi:cytochrome c peroxidase